ncbi:MAG TPA: hypothetical protein PLW94_02375 [Candidatus Absconditabacterales bacterium]|nr:hypothetical protein [Candidatus Absconditabacterales bacterium]
MGEKEPIGPEIESLKPKQEDPSVFDNEENLIQSNKIQTEVIESRSENKEWSDVLSLLCNEKNIEPEKIKKLLNNRDTFEMLLKKIGLDKSALLNSSTNILQKLEFLVDEDIKKETLKHYESCRSQIINKLIDITIESPNADENQIKKMKKLIRKIKKYGNGEFIDFPNGISFELCRKSELKGQDISDAVVLGENEYFLVTHIEKRNHEKKTRYGEYVDSLLEMKKILKDRKGIDVKYCRRSTWLVNRCFVEGFEEYRKLQAKEQGKKYNQSNVWKVIEDTQFAVIGEPQFLEGGEKHIIPSGSLQKYIESDIYKDNCKKNSNAKFGETIVWLDLDKLPK